MFTKGIILSEAEYRTLWNDFIDMLRERLNEMDEDERAEILRSRDEFEDWLKDQVVEMFDLILEDHDAEAAIIYVGSMWRYVPDGEEFYYLSYRREIIPDVIEELMKEFRGSVEENRRKYYKRRRW